MLGFNDFFKLLCYELIWLLGKGYSTHPESYYPEPILWAGFLTGLRQTLLLLILFIHLGYKTVSQGALNGIWVG